LHFKTNPPEKGIQKLPVDRSDSALGSGIRRRLELDKCSKLKAALKIGTQILLRCCWGEEKMSLASERKPLSAVH